MNRMSKPPYTDKEIEKEINRSFDEDYSVFAAEEDDRWADAETEQGALTIEEQAEDDPFLRAELDALDTEAGEIPDEYPFNDSAWNVSVLLERELEESADVEIEQNSTSQDSAEEEERYTVSNDEDLLKVLDKPLSSIDFVLPDSPSSNLAHSVEPKKIEVMPVEQFLESYSPDSNGTLGFFIKAALILGGLYLLIVGLVTVLGGNEHREWTSDDERAAIKECARWGGTVIYDNRGMYVDCAINGRVTN